MPPAADVFRVLFAIAFFGGQAALIATGSERADGAFAFRMFNQSSRITVSLYRETIINGSPVTIPVKNGEWTAKDRYGVLRRFAWKDRVKNHELRAFDHSIHASYGVEAQTERFHAALLDVALHLQDDTETLKLILEITQQRNGHDEQRVRFEAGIKP